MRSENHGTTHDTFFSSSVASRQLPGRRSSGLFRRASSSRFSTDWEFLLGTQLMLDDLAALFQHPNVLRPFGHEWFVLVEGDQLQPAFVKFWRNAPETFTSIWNGRLKRFTGKMALSIPCSMSF